MCGIVGFFESSRQTSPEALKVIALRMVRSLIHRGPDDIGAIVLENAALAMSRLSIIDLAGGQQPIPNEDKSRWIVYNGEIYNFLDLRRELEALGHRFRTSSDTEVILHAYEAWGPDCVRRLRGMFSFCIVTAPEQTQESSSTADHESVRVFRSNAQWLFLARDRVGKKPLYYYHDAERFIFASEIKGILMHPNAPRRVNYRVIPLFLAHGYVPAPCTMFEEIYELPPGHTLTLEDGQVKIREYWDITYPRGSTLHRSEREIVEQLRVLLEEAVRIRLVSEVPLGAFLSGGIDSTAVVAFMTRLTGRPVKTFAIGFEGDPSFNELEYAHLAAQAYGTDHHEFVVQPDAIELLPKIVWHYDQPFADSSAIPTYLVSRLSREHVTVALTGEGGDELFAGYERFTAARVAQIYGRTPHFMQIALAHLVSAVPESTSYGSFVRRARRFLENAPLPLAQRYLGWISIFQNGLIAELLADGTKMYPVDHFQSCFARVHDVDLISQLLYVHAKTCLPGDLLVKTDRMSMANSLETRCPFLDQELIEFAASIPSDFKLKRFTTKYILKKALEGLVPREIIYRKKHGFGVPVGHWFRTDLKDYLQDTLLSPRSLQRGYFKEESLRQLINEHLNGLRDHGLKLWALLTLEIWHRLYVDVGIESSFST